MYYGKMTDELIELRKKHYELFKCDPIGNMELEYSENDYEKFIKDIKEAIKNNKPL